MYKTVLGIEGMACGMCENHLCDEIRKSLEVRSVKASHRRKSAEIVTEAPLGEADVRRCIAPTGYVVTSFVCAPEAPKRGLLARLFG